MDEITIKTLIFLPLGKKEFCAAGGCMGSLMALKVAYIFVRPLGRTFPFKYGIKTPNLAIKSLTFLIPAYLSGLLEKIKHNKRNFNIL